MVHMRLPGDDYAKLHVCHQKNFEVLQLDYNRCLECTIDFSGEWNMTVSIGF